MIINKLLTSVNCKKSSNRKIKYIVIHYVGATGGAEANCKYFRSTYRGSSAHYFIGHNGEVWQCVEDKNIAWHCGSKYKINNNNSIGVEMCCHKKNGKWYFEDATVKAAMQLTRMLMNKYSIPAECVVRHYDVSGKVCPEPYVRDSKAWSAFKSGLIDKNIDEIAREVIRGKYGNGKERVIKLSGLGYNYALVQDRVNELLGKK